MAWDYHNELKLFDWHHQQLETSIRSIRQPRDSRWGQRDTVHGKVIPGFPPATRNNPRSRTAIPLPPPTSRTIFKQGLFKLKQEEPTGKTTTAWKHSSIATMTHHAVLSKCNADFAKYYRGQNHTWTSGIILLRKLHVYSTPEPAQAK